MDNTVYHKGYPTCFRSAGGTPSIQVSLTRDATRADIDVDYRSSKFPTFLVNGHLTASNSDVRAGDNSDRHNNQWAGLQNWWRNLLGFPKEENEEVASRKLLPEPRVKYGDPGDAVHDFLDSWLVKQNPTESVAYVTEDALACAEVETGRKLDRGMAKFAMVKDMLAVNKKLGKISSVDQVSTSVDYQNERLKLIDQSHGREFTLFKVREDLAEQVSCVNKLDSAEISPKAAKSKDFGKYVGALFRVHTPGKPGVVVATLWQKQSGYWKLTSYDVDPGINQDSVPHTPSQTSAAPALEHVDGDPDMTRAAAEFLNTWLLKKKVGRAMDYLAPDFLACVSLYASDAEAANSSESQRQLLERGMMRTASAVNGARNIEDAIAASEPSHPDLKLVRHKHDRAFVIVSVPNAMGEAASCGNRSAGSPHFARSASKPVYGKYYATGFSMNNGTGNESTLWILWEKVSGSWKGISFLLLTS
jgi:hypothetical protein